MNYFCLLAQASRELGLHPLWLNTLYRLGIKTGYWILRTPPQAPNLSFESEELFANFDFKPPEQKALSGFIPEENSNLLQIAEEICNGKIRLYGSTLIPVQLAPPLSNLHWSKISEHKLSQDIKDIWEVARFSWSFALLRAYIRYGDEKYADIFWQFFENFVRENPVNLGPNWISAQEVALRLIVWTMAGAVLKTSVHSTNDRMQLLIRSIFAHARRIPPTLVYARAQNNNHLLVEAAGLYTAGVLFNRITKARKWKEQGWYWFHYALQNQISEDGAYCQNSTNYHRLMLQIALWTKAVSEIAGEHFPQKTLQKLTAATRWLLAHMDPISGRVPNLGHNDGAYIFPLSESDFSDYRPVAQACARAFLQTPYFQPGPWDEMSLWFGLELNTKGHQDFSCFQSREVFKLGNSQSWATIRIAHHTTRPAHADQLHVDLWWQGENIALDAGTYRYNAPPPWQNALACTAVHNTVEVDMQDQMVRAGKFLWLRWSQAHVLNNNPDKIVAFHTGYEALGILHQRELAHPKSNYWKVTDRLLPTQSKRTKKLSFVLHWLLPDLSWELQDSQLRLTTPFGMINLNVTIPDAVEKDVVDIQVIRAGERLIGSGPVLPYLGWYSPTYGDKRPALSYRVIVSAVPPLIFHSEWELKSN